MSDIPISAGRLKSFIERVEKLIEERKAIQSDIRDTLSEAKGVGYNVPIMRKVLALRAMDASDRAEQEVLLDAYMHALETVDRVQARVAAGESVRAVGASEGVSRMTAHRLSQKDDKAGNGTAHDPETGEIDQSCGPCPVPPGSVAPTSDGNGLRTKGKAEPLADSPREHSLAGCDGVLAGSVTTPQCEDRASPGPQDDPGPLPAFLRRVPA